MGKKDDSQFVPSNSLGVRPAVSTDALAIYEFMCDLEALALDSELFRDVFNRNLANPMVYYLVAEQADQVIGFVSCHVQYLLHHTGKVGEIQELYVRPEYRNQRVGHRLVEALYALSIRENFVNLEVTTNQKRMDTVRFYERESFRCTHYKLVKPILPDAP